MVLLNHLGFIKFYKYTTSFLKDQEKTRKNIGLSEGSLIKEKSHLADCDMAFSLR